MKTSLFLAAALVLVQSTRATSAELAAEDYAALVHRCLKGQSRIAVGVLSRASREDIARAAQDYGGRWLTEPQIRAATLLHTEAIVGGSRDFRFHVDAARHWMGRGESSERQDFKRHWYALLAYYFMSSVQTAEARAVLESAILEFPEDGKLRLALGTVYETGAWIEDNSAFLNEAGEHFRAVVASEPDSVEARLRLGRVLAMQKKTDEASTEIEWVLLHTEDPQLQLVSHLTIGSIRKGESKLDEAIDSYRKALALDPKCQAAAMALAHALHASGDREGSRQLLETFFEQSELVSADDSWLRYLLGHSDRYETLLREMRAEVRP
jgi:tetratricopeptide (TPR) repeat protein